MKPPGSTSARAAAALLAEQGVGVATDERGVVLERACVAIHRRLAPWIGADGCTRLLVRALTLAAERHTVLRDITIMMAPPYLVDVDAFARASPAVARQAAEAFIGSVFDDLGRLVGDAVALRIVLPESPESWGTSRSDGDEP